MAWRDEPATELQLAYIAEMQEFSPYPIARFNGTTRGDASDYIDRWKEMSHKSMWAIEHGYE